MTAKLSVNLNGPAYLRNRRGLPWPDVAALGRIALDAGAAGLTVHPRPDGRHIRREDVFALADVVGQAGAEFNLEGYPDAAFLALIAEVRPSQVTFVPDAPGQATSDHGWAVETQRAVLQPAITAAKNAGARVSLFIDPDPAQCAPAKALGADRIELFTGPYGAAFEPAIAERELRNLAEAGRAAQAVGLGVNAGHDLTRENLPALALALPGLDEVSIGHALTADALIFGMSETVRLYLEALRPA